MVDFDGDTISYGNDIYFSTGNYAQEEGLTAMSSGRPSDFGIEMYQETSQLLIIKV